jgi:hypothetical protein
LEASASLMTLTFAQDGLKSTRQGPFSVTNSTIQLRKLNGFQTIKPICP